MKTTVVCGLLGSGKTTFIQKYIGKRAGKVVVLVNDFGKAGIDGEIFSAGGIESVELPSGCVCCTLKFDLITTVEKIVAAFAPEHLIIEPSGIASPSGVLEALDIVGIKTASVIGMVDATEFIELHEAQMFGAFFEDQIMNSDIILVNKADLAGEEKTSTTVDLVEAMNPRAIVFRTVNADLKEDLPSRPPGKRFINRQATHFDFDTISLRLDGGGDSLFFRRFFEDLAKGLYGNVVRAKALVRTDQGSYRFDLSSRMVDVALFVTPIAESRLVVIGKDLRKEALAEAILHSRSDFREAPEDAK